MKKKELSYIDSVHRDGTIWNLSVMALILAMGASGMLEFFTMSRFRVLLTADQHTYVVSLASMTSPVPLSSKRSTIGCSLTTADSATATQRTQTVISTAPK